MSAPLLALWRWFDSGSHAPVIVGTVAGLAGAVSSCALRRWDETTLVSGLRLRVDGDGVRWTGGRPGSIPWASIACLAIVGPPPRRRLWIARQGKWIPNAGRSQLTSAIMRCLRLERLELDLPLWHLDADDAALTDAIRTASQGAFPTTGQRPGNASRQAGSQPPRNPNDGTLGRA